MDNLVERVARAICLQAFGYETPTKSDYDIARAAIEAMRSPLENLLAGWGINPDAYQAMIDEALNAEKSPRP